MEQRPHISAGDNQLQIIKNRLLGAVRTVWVVCGEGRTDLKVAMRNAKVTGEKSLWNVL